MDKFKKTRVILWVAVIVLFAIYAYVYVGNPLQKEFDLGPLIRVNQPVAVGNPLQKEFDLGIFGLVFPLLFGLLHLLFRKNKFKREIALVSSSGLLIIFYLIFL